MPKISTFTIEIAAPPGAKTETVEKVITVDKTIAAMAKKNNLGSEYLLGRLEEHILKNQVWYFKDTAAADEVGPKNGMEMLEYQEQGRFVWTDNFDDFEAKPAMGGKEDDGGEEKKNDGAAAPDLAADSNVAPVFYHKTPTLLRKGAEGHYEPISEFGYEPFVPEVVDSRELQDAIHSLDGVKLSASEVLKLTEYIKEPNEDDEDESTNVIRVRVKNVTKALFNEALDIRRRFEAAIFRKANTRQVGPEGTWFLVERGWLDEWRMFTKGLRGPPGPLQNDKLVNGAGQPRPGLVAKRDYR